MPVLRRQGGRYVTSVPPMRARAAARLDEARDHAQRRGLAAAGGPEQHQELAVGDVERHARDHGVLAVALGQVAELAAAPSDDHLRDLHVAVGHDHRDADQRDLHHRDGRDRRIDLPFEILQDRDRQRGAARRRPGTGSFRDCRTRSRSRTARRRRCRAGSPAASRGGTSVHGGAPRFFAASSIVGSKPARLAVTSRATHGMTISTCAAISPAVEPSSGRPVAISVSIWNT